MKPSVVYMHGAVIPRCPYRLAFKSDHAHFLNGGGYCSICLAVTLDLKQLGDNV